MKLCGAPGGDVRSPTKIRCGLDFYLNGRKIERFYVSLLCDKGAIFENLFADIFTKMAENFTSSVWIQVWKLTF